MYKRQILIGAVGIGLMAGMPLSDIIGSVNEGIGNTLKGIALLVGLGSMFGAILEESGGAPVSYTHLKERMESFAPLFTGSSTAGQAALAALLPNTCLLYTSDVYKRQLQRGAEIAHQRAADAACVQLVDLDAGLLQEAAVDADLTRCV